MAGIRSKKSIYTGLTTAKWGGHTVTAMATSFILMINSERKVVMDSLLQLIFFGLGALCFIFFLTARRTVCLAMDCAEYDGISYALTWIFCSPIAALGVYFWWVALI